MSTLQPPIPNAALDILPPRGMAAIDSSNRGAVRKWLTARGASYAQIANLTIAQLSAAYNDETDAALRSILAGTPPAAQAAAPAAAARPPVAAPAAAPPATNGHAPDAALAAALAAYLPTPQAAAMDEARVIELITEHAPASPQVTVWIQGVPLEPRELPAGLRHCAFPAILAAVSFDSVFIAGPAGAGKTTLAEQCAESLGTPFYFTGAVASEYKLTGFIDAHGRTVRTAFREAFEHGGLFLFDEIDASDPGALLAFNAALSNGQFDFPDGTVKRHADFRCIASANTWGGGASREYVGRNQLDAATLDRFARIAMDYDPQLENLVARSLHKHGEAIAFYVQEVRAACRAHSIRHVVSPRMTYRTCKALAAGVTLADALNLSLEGMDADSRARVDTLTDTAREALAQTLTR